MSGKNNKDKAKNRQGNASAKHYATIVAQRLRRIPKKVGWGMAFLVAVAYSWVFYSDGGLSMVTPSTPTPMDCMDATSVTTRVSLTGRA